MSKLLLLRARAESLSETLAQAVQPHAGVGQHFLNLL